MIKFSSIKFNACIYGINRTKVFRKYYSTKKIIKKFMYILQTIHKKIIL
jgi:hypothetical protein